MSLFCSCRGTSPRVKPNTSGALPVTLVLIAIGAILASWLLLSSFDSTAHAHESWRFESAESQKVVSQKDGWTLRIKTFECVIDQDSEVEIVRCIENAAADAEAWINSYPLSIIEFRTDLSTASYANRSFGENRTVYVITIFYQERGRDQ
jgi:hypothetical protein